MSRVLHTAQALVDVILEIDDLPPRGGNANVRREQKYAGGAVTTLIAAARTGAVAVHGGAHGTGPYGDLIREALARDGVALSDDPRPDADTGYCTVLLEQSAERTFLTVYGAEREVTAVSLATLGPRPGDLVCVSGFSLFEPTREPLLEFLESLPDGVDVVHDPGAPFADFSRELRRRVLARVTVWTSNADEARALTDLYALEDTPEAIRRHLRPGAVVVVRDGDRGCLVFHHGRGTEIPAFPMTPVDTNGAGDTHTGVLLAERALGADWESAATRANAAAALTVTRRGTESVFGRDEVDAFLD